MIAKKVGAIISKIYAGRPGKDPACCYLGYRKPIILIIAAIVSIFSVVFTIKLGLKPTRAVLFGEAIFIMFATIFKARRELSSISVNLIALLWAFVIFWMMQLATSIYITDIFLADLSGAATNNFALGLFSGIVRVVFNTLLIYSLIMLFSAIFRSMKVGLVIVMVVSVGLGIANNFVVQSRGREISFVDIKSIGTAMAVAGDYSYTLALCSIIAIIGAIVSIIHIVKSDYPKFSGFKKPGKHFVTAVVALVICVSTVFSGVSIGYASKTYRAQGTQYNGYYLNFIYSIKNSKVKAPETYSPGALLDAISKNDFSGLTSGESTPNVIVIMNETFSDLKNVCDSSDAEKTLETNVELLPYWNSLENGVTTDENGRTQTIIKGDALSSVYGGNTANSEYEFLSGTSMSFFPAGTVAYNGKINKENAYTLVNFFNSAGYRTIAMHPELAENWSRNSIYKYFGFDEIYFKDGFTGLTKEDYYRGHVSDAAVYDKIIDLYENKEDGEKFFTFAITMMNHGGYSHNSFNSTVSILGDEDQSEACEYLTSVNEADKSLKELIDYFSEVEEETLIVFFGDHQPTMPSSFIEQYMGLTDDSTTEELQTMYKIPYMFWSNFKAESNISDRITSINYLSSVMLDICSVPRSDFFRVLSQVRETIPAINAFGWYDIDGDFHDFKDQSDADITEKEKKALELYEHFVFNLIFDDDNKMTSLFDAPVYSDKSLLIHTVGSLYEHKKSPKIFVVK